MRLISYSFFRFSCFVGGKEEYNRVLATTRGNASRTKDDGGVPSTRNCAIAVTRSPAITVKF